MSFPLVLVWRGVTANRSSQKAFWSVSKKLTYTNSWELSHTSVDSYTAELTHGALRMASSSWVSTHISLFFVAADAYMGICFILSQGSCFCFPSSSALATVQMHSLTTLPSVNGFSCWPKIQTSLREHSWAHCWAVIVCLRILLNWSYWALRPLIILVLIWVGMFVQNVYILPHNGVSHWHF